MEQNKPKIGLIAGGSGGIGGAIAKSLAARGWNVVIGFNKSRPAAENVAHEINGGGKGPRAWAMALPLTASSDFDPLLAAIEKIGGRLDGLVLSASPAPNLVSFQKTTAADLTEQLQVNAVASQALIAAVWKRFFQKQNGGHVLAVSSKAAGSPPWPHMSAYVAGKRALETVLESALAELGTSGLRGTVLRLGYTETPMLTGIHPHLLEAARAKSGGSFLQPNDVGERIAQLLESSPASAELRMAEMG